MAHFGVKKAKTLLAVAGITAIAAGAGVAFPANNANAAVSSFDQLVRGTDYDCSTTDGNEVILSSANAIQWATSNQNDFYKTPTGTNCYVDFGSEEIIASNVSFSIASGTYEFDSAIEYTGGGNYNNLFVKNGSNVVFTATSDANGLKTNYKTAPRDPDMTDEQYAAFDFDHAASTIRVESGGSLSIQKGTYEYRLYNEGTMNIGAATLYNSYVDTRSGGETTFTGSTFSAADTLYSGIVNTSNSKTTINSGTYTGESHSYNVNLGVSMITNDGTLDIKGGTFSFDPRNDVLKATVNGKERKYCDEPHGFIDNHSSGVVNITGGTFNNYGVFVGTVSSNSQMNIGTTGGNDSDITITTDNMVSTWGYTGSSVDLDSVINVKSGKIITRDTFYIDDTENVAGNDVGSSAGIYRDSNGDLRGNFCTGPNCSSPFFIGGISAEGEQITGGTFTDEDGVTPEPGYDKVELDEDSDGDGDGDVKVLPVRNHSIGDIAVGDYQDYTVPEGSTIISSDLGSYCTATITGTTLRITGVAATPAGKSCKVTTSDKSTAIDNFEAYVTDYIEGEELHLSVGETVTPTDLGGKKPTDFSWGIVAGNDSCEINQNGAITGTATGVCIVTATDASTREVRYWYVTVTEPLELEIGESKKPTLPEYYDYDEGDWSSDNTDVCTVSEDGTVTAVKAGTCHISFKNEGYVEFVWDVTVKGNPNTADKNLAINFATAGAVIGGLGALLASIKRFGRN